MFLRLLGMWSGVQYTNVLVQKIAKLYQILSLSMLCCMHYPFQYYQGNPLCVSFANVFTHIMEMSVFFETIKIVWSRRPSRGVIVTHVFSCTGRKGNKRYGCTVLYVILAFLFRFETKVPRFIYYIIFFTYLKQQYTVKTSCF